MHSSAIAPMSPLMTTGCWEGAMISEPSGESMPFALRQPARDLRQGMTIHVADQAPAPVRVLDGAARTIVGLVESQRLLIEARIRSGRLVGRWLRRDQGGSIIASGPLVARRSE